MNYTALWYILDRLKERGTWLSLGSALTGMGVLIAPQKWDLIMAIGMGVPGIVTAFLPPRIQEKNIVPAPAVEPSTPLAKAMVDKVVDNTTAKPV